MDDDDYVAGVGRFGFGTKGSTKTLGAYDRSFQPYLDRLWTVLEEEPNTERKWRLIELMATNFICSYKEELRLQMIELLSADVKSMVKGFGNYLRDKN